MQRLWRGGSAGAGRLRLLRAAPCCRPQARQAVYHTPHSPADTAWVVEHHVRVAPWLSRLKPAWEALRSDLSRALTRDEFLELCPRAQTEVVEGLFSTFDRAPHDGRLSYEEMCAYVLLASDRGSPEEKIESIFPLCDVDGDHVVHRGELAGALRMIYFARFRDLEVVDLKVEKLMEELTADTEDETLTLMQFAEWARSDQDRVTELCELLRSPIVSVPDEGRPETWPVQARVAFEKIKVDNPIVELDGDEMTRIMWQMIKEKLIFPFLDMDIDYHDLSITYRDETDDQVTHEAAAAIQRYQVGVKCATITPDTARMLEYNLQRLWKNPTSTIRRILNGTVFTVPIAIRGISQHVKNWHKPIILGRHAHADQYNASELVAEGPGTFELTFRPGDGESPAEVTAYTFKSSGGGVMLGMYNTRESIESFARCCFEFALGEGLPLYLSTKNTVLKEYDGLFIDVFHSLYQSCFKKAFEEKGLWYQHRQIDDMVGRALQSTGGFVWATKNYDGDVLSNLLVQGYGSPGLVTSVLLSADGGTLLAEAAHGTITRHYRLHQKGEKTSTNPLASIFAWSRGLGHRARLDGNERLLRFSRALEEACVSCVESGRMTQDLADCMHGTGAAPDTWLLTEELISACANELRVVLSKPLRAPQTAQDAPFAER